MPLLPLSLLHIYATYPYSKSIYLSLTEQKNAEGKSWLIDWWNSWAYMDYKDSVVINVSYAFNFVEPRVRVSQTRRAAQLIYGAVKFKQELDAYCSPFPTQKDAP